MLLRGISLLVVVAFGLGCAQRLPVVCAQVGVLAGGVGGAIAIGDNTDKDSAKSGAGALGGAVVGAVAGYYLCKLFEEKEEPKRRAAPAPKSAPPATAPAEVSQKIVLRGVNFDFDKSRVRSDAAVILDVAADLLKENAGVRVRVVGHTDWTGPESYNQQLSEQRASAVRDYLVGAGVDAGRLSPAGFGESQPMATNETREGRALNRRVELQVLD